MDYETATSHNITVRATSSDGSIADKSFVINVTNYSGDDNSPPTATAGVRYNVSPDFTGGWVASVDGTDPDGDQLTYTIVNVNDGPGFYEDFNLSDQNGWYMSGNNVYTTFANIQHTGEPDVTFLTVNVSDGQETITVTRIIYWQAPFFLGPIVLDLDDDGVEMVSIGTSTVMFDVDGDGILENTGWVGADDGLLVLDRNGNGVIDDGSEISFVQDTLGATTDLEGLVAFDSNNDGVFDANDDQFADFQVWQDVNQDGISQASELKSLSEMGITSIDLTPVSSGEQPSAPRDNIIVNTTSISWTDGSTSTAGDVMFRYIDAFDPIVIDLDGDGADVVQLAQSNVEFDVDGDGQVETTAWIGPDDGILAIDRNGDGLINNMSEITFVQDSPGAMTDIEGLAAFDSNDDGVLDSNDDRWGDFVVWQDLNQDGISQSGELLSLEEAGISSIDLSPQENGEIFASSSDFADGTVSLLESNLSYYVDPDVSAGG